MRIIKYKALGTKGWTPTENKGWFYGTNNIDEVLSDDKQTSHLYHFEKMIRGNYYDGSTRCQFTGLLDDDGVEIYENDILSNSYMDDYQDTTSTVVFKDGMWKLKATNNNNFRPLYDDGVWCSIYDPQYGEVKVIGNQFIEK